MISHLAARLIGADQLRLIGRIVPVVDAAGNSAEGHIGLIPHDRRSAIRSKDERCPAALCHECGRLLYWPGWPPSANWQVLQRDWEEESELGYIGDCILCSETFWKEVLEPAKFPRIKGHKIAVVDEPPDGLPADYDEMLAELRRREAYR
jgi:hypothetical protein